jgi:hypothetical protein
LRNPTFAPGMEITMSIVQWLDQLAAGFGYRVQW